MKTENQKLGAALYYFITSTFNHTVLLSVIHLTHSVQWYLATCLIMASLNALFSELIIKKYFN